MSSIPGRSKALEKVEPQRSVKNALRSARYFYAMTFQWLCSQMLCRRVPTFVIGAEGASLDAGLLLVNSDELTKYEGLGNDEKLSEAKKEYGNEQVVVAIDFKTVSPKIRTWPTHPQYVLDYNQVTGAQASAGACLIIGSPLDRNFVACVPGSVWKTMTKVSAFYFVNGGADVQAFDPALAPFIMRLQDLPMALERFYALCQRKQDGPW